MKLIIFDLDQTLVEFLPVHDRALEELFKRHFGVEARFADTDFAGRSMLENFRTLAGLKGVPQERFEAALPNLIPDYERLFEGSIPKNADEYVLPGVKGLLEILARTNNVIALYTGDSPAVAQAILRATGLGKYFTFSFYGTEVASRADMVRQAIESARKLTGHDFRKRDIVIIGDSIRDIECGKLFNALTIAVATGPNSRDELASYRPDYLFESLQEYERLASIIAPG